MNQSLSFIHPEAIIGKNVTISPFAYVARDVIIGDNTYIGPHVTILEHTRIGENCKIFPNAVIGAVPQDLKFEGEYSTLEIGNNVIIRECCTLNRGTSASGKTSIGDNCLLMAYVHVAHDCVIGNNVILANSTNLGGHVEVDDFTVIGGLSGIHQFVKIGKHVMISGMSGVAKDVPSYITVGSNPIRYVGINSIGLRRRGFSNDDIHTIQDIYRLLYQSNLNITQAVQTIIDNIEPSPFKKEVLKFIEKSDRGLVKGYV